MSIEKEEEKEKKTTKKNQYQKLRAHTNRLRAQIKRLEKENEKEFDLM